MIKKENPKKNKADCIKNLKILKFRKRTENISLVKIDMILIKKFN